MLVTNYKTRIVHKFQKVDNARREIEMNKQYFYAQAPKSHVQLGYEEREVLN